MTKTKNQKNPKSPNIVLSERITVQYSDEYPRKEENAYEAWAEKWKFEVQIVSTEYEENEDFTSMEVDILCTKDAASDVPVGLTYSSNWVATGISTVTRQSREEDINFVEQCESEMQEYIDQKHKLDPPLKLFPKKESAE